MAMAGPLPKPKPRMRAPQRRDPAKAKPECGRSPTVAPEASPRDLHQVAGQGSAKAAHKGLRRDVLPDKPALK